MFGGDYGGVWTPKLAASDGKSWTLDLELMAGKPSAFPKKKIWVDKELRRVTQVEDYDEESKKARTTTFSGYAKDEGGADHQSPKTTACVDHRRNDHRTELKILSATTDQNLPDETFTKEILKSK
jgi:Outer membrane lipoprotein-sorting protein